MTCNKLLSGKTMVDVESRAKARRISNERNLAALANDTKWSEFFLEAHARELKFEIKYIDVDTPTIETRVWIPAQNYLETTVCGPELFVFIEWVRSNNIEEVSDLAGVVGLEHFEIDGKVVVYGYK